MATYAIENAKWDGKREVLTLTAIISGNETRKITFNMNAYDFITYLGLTGRLRTDGERRENTDIGNTIEFEPEDLSNLEIIDGLI